MKFYFQKRLFFGSLAAIAFLIWLAVNPFPSAKNFAETSKEQLVSLTVEMGINRWDYILAFGEAFLRSTFDTLDERLVGLISLTIDNSSQQNRLSIFQNLINKKRAFNEQYNSMLILL